MTVSFLFPWALLGLLLVAGVAAWTLLRRGRQTARVGTFRLWEKALRSLDRSARRHTRRVTAAWILLLLGSVLAVLAASGLVVGRSRQHAVVAIDVQASVEFASPEGTARLADAVGQLADRLGPDVRVHLLHPSLTEGEPALLSPSEAAGRVRTLPAVWAHADQFQPASPAGVQHTYVVGSFREIPEPTDPSVSIIPVRPPLPAAVLETVGAKPVAQGQMELFTAVRNASSDAWSGRLRVLATDDTAEPRLLRSVELSIPAGGRTSRTLRLPDAAGLVVTLAEPSEADRPGQLATVASQPAGSRTVAMIGTDDIHLRRFIDVHPSLTLVGEPTEAEAVIAIGKVAPEGTPALVIAPPTAPPGHRLAEETLGPIVLSDATVHGGVPAFTDVFYDGVAVRRARPFVPAAGQSGTSLVSLEQGVLILRSQSAGPPSRRVWLAFDPAVENSTWPRQESYLVFLNATFRWLLDGLNTQRGYGSESPMDVGSAAGLERVFPPGPVTTAGDQLPPPGLYRDAQANLTAVSILPEVPADDTEPLSQIIAGVPLPSETEAVRRGVELWPVLALLAVTALLAGWFLRTR